MKQSLLSLIVILIAIVGCNPVKKENRDLVKLINYKLAHIDGNHRVQIIEDDFHQGDSIFKIRAYYMDEYLVKIVSVLRTSHIERDDYFYFEKNEPIFSGHMYNLRDDHSAEEYKFYYENGRIEESLYWADTYEPGKKFPHERFKEYEPNVDSLMESEKERLTFCLEKLAMEGFEILHLNENLEANSIE
ncbi:MAG: hypothetical protein JXQ90_20330 [Cyclobacteriaceae bacterium]